MNTLLDWLAKEWYFKLYDLGLALLGIGGLFTIIIVGLKTLKKVGNPEIIKDGNKLSFKFTDVDGKEREVSNNDLIALLTQKEDKIKELEGVIKSLQERLSVLELNLQKQAAVEDFKKAQVVPLTEHQVFFNLRRNMEAGVELKVKSENKIKKELAKVFLEQCKMKVFHNRLKEYVVKISDIALPEIEKQEMLYNIVSKIYDWVDEYSIVANTIEVVLEDGRRFHGIVPSFIKAFNEWHTPHVEIVVKKIQSVLYSEFYSTWQLKLIVILDHIDTAFYLTIQDAEATIDNLNGQVEIEINRKLNG